MRWLFLAALVATAAVSLAEVREVVPVESHETKRERMALRCVLVGGQTLAVGGFDYMSRDCLRGVSALDQSGAETTLPLCLAVGRNHFGTIALDDHRVLVVGGYSEQFGSLASVECLDLRLARPEAWPWLAEPVELFTLNRFENMAIVIGGLIAQGKTATRDSIQTIDLITGETHIAPNHLQTSRFGHATVWSSAESKFLIFGGKHVDRAGGKAVYACTDSVERYDPRTNAVDDGGRLTVPRDRPVVEALPNGRVLVIGGSSDQGPLDSIELYDSWTHSSKVVAHMSAPRMAALVLPVPGGFLIAGGWSDQLDKARAIEFLDFQTLTTKIVGHAKVCRAEGAMVKLTDSTFALIGGKDAFNGRDPHSYSFTQTEVFQIK